MKKILLKLAYLINKHYKTIEIKEGNYIKYRGLYFIIESASLIRDIFSGSELDIKAIDANKTLYGRLDV